MFIIEAYIVVAVLVAISVVIESWLYPDPKYYDQGFTFSLGLGLVIGFFWPMLIYRTLQNFKRT